MIVRRGLRAGVAMVLLGSGALAAAACGERVDHAQVVNVAEGRAPDGTLPSGTVLTTTAAGPAVAGPTAPAPTTGGPVAPAGPTGAVSVPTGGAVGPIATTGPGAVTPTTGTTGSKGPIAPGSSAPATQATGKQDTSPVMLCQVGHFTGIAGPPQGYAQPGLAAWVKWTNAHGGLAGHPVQLDSKDDQIDPNKTQQIVQNCVQNEHAVAIVAAFVPATVDSIATYVAQHKVPMVGGDGITRTWFTNPDFFPEGSSNRGTAEGQVDIVVRANTLPMAIIYCTENVGCTVGKDEVSKAAQRRNVPVKGIYQVSLASPTFSSQCSSMQSAGVKAVYTALDGSSVGRLARDCNAIGYKPLYVAGGFAFDANAITSDPTLSKNLDGITLTDAVFPWMLDSFPAAHDFQTAMATYAPDVKPTESAAIAWVSGQELAKAIENVGDEARTGPITSALIIKGLTMFKNEKLGGLVMGGLTFHANAPVTEDVCWGVTKLQGGQWIAPQGGTSNCAS